MALIAGGVRSADVTSTSDVRMLKITTAAYKKASDTCRIRFERMFLRLLVDRLKQANAKLVMI